MAELTTEHPLAPAIRAALHTVNDPEIHRPITDLGMVDKIDVDADGQGSGTRAADRERLPDAGHAHPRGHRRRCGDSRV